MGKLVKETSELGAYRVRAALEQIGIHLSQATCGRLLALNRKISTTQTQWDYLHEHVPGRDDYHSPEVDAGLQFPAPLGARKA